MIARIDGPRGCRAEEVPQVIRLVDAAMREGSDQTMLTDYPLVYAPGNLENVQVLTVDGRVVATAPVLPRRVEGDGFSFGLGVISPTATDPEHQHHGYGSACVAACVRRMATLGLELSVLWTRIPTFPFYERNGWQAVARSGASVVLGPTDASSFPPWAGGVVPLADQPHRLPDVMALHAAARAGVLRTAGEMRALTMLPGITTWLALEGIVVRGYLVASTASNKPGLLEAAGDQAAIGGLIHHVLAGLVPGTTVEVDVGDEFPAVAQAVDHALPTSSPVPSTADMMVRLNDPAGFLRSALGWLEAHWGPDRDPVSVAVTDAAVTVAFRWVGARLRLDTDRCGRHLELTRRELTSMLFGSHPERPVAVPGALAGLPSFRLPIPALDRS